MFSLFSFFFFILVPLCCVVKITQQDTDLTKSLYRKVVKSPVLVTCRDSFVRDINFPTRWRYTNGVLRDSRFVENNSNLLFGFKRQARRLKSIRTALIGFPRLLNGTIKAFSDNNDRYVQLERRSTKRNVRNRTSELEHFRTEWFWTRTVLFLIGHTFYTLPHFSEIRCFVLVWIITGFAVPLINFNYKQRRINFWNLA